MKRRALTLFLVGLLSISLIGSISAAYDEKMHEDPVSSLVEIPFEEETAAFTKMLNLNYLYNEAFVSDADLIEGVMLSLLPEADEGRLLKTRVADYMLDFYGIVMNESAYDQTYVSGEHFYYIPKGFNRSVHTVISIDFDGEYYTVVSDVIFNSHDAIEEPVKATSVFVKNENSTFGYNLLSCVLE